MLLVGHTFPANPDAEGLPVWRANSSTWSVSNHGCAFGRAPCAYLRTTYQPNGTVAPLRFRSAAFDIIRTRHGMNLSLGLSIKGVGAGGGVSACVTVVSWDDLPYVCKPLPLFQTWKFHELNFVLPSWLPATVAAAITVTGAPVSVWLDDIELWQHRASLPHVSSSCAINLIPQFGQSLVSASSIWHRGQELKIAVRAAATSSCTGVPHAVTISHQILTPTGLQLTSHYGVVSIGENWTVKIPMNVSGGVLLNLTAVSADIVVAKFTYRMLIAPSQMISSSSALGQTLPNEFAFCSTVEWHVQAALLGSGLLERQMQAHRGLGINCLHVYLSEDRMLQMMEQPFALAVANAVAKANMTYLFTLLPNGILDNKCGQPGSSCRNNSAFPVSAFCKHVVATHVPPNIPLPRPGKTTRAQLERVCELVRRLAQKMKRFVKYWALEGEPQSNGLAVGEYAARVLPVLSVAVRDGAGPEAILIGGGIGAFASKIVIPVVNNSV